MHPRARLSPAEDKSARGPCDDASVVTRTQLLVIGFLAVAWLSIVALIGAAPDVFDEALRLGKASAATRWGTLGLITGVIGLLTVGVIRRWRWTFWLIVFAFLAGILRVPVSLLEATDVIHSSVPIWYIAYQGSLGITQFIVGTLMLLGYRRAGYWASFRCAVREG